MLSHPMKVLLIQSHGLRSCAALGLKTNLTLALFPAILVTKMKVTLSSYTGVLHCITVLNNKSSNYVLRNNFSHKNVVSITNFSLFAFTHLVIVLG